MSVRVRSPYRKVDVNIAVPNTVQQVKVEAQVPKRKKKSEEITESSDSDEVL
jgi:hypothetical protein